MRRRPDSPPRCDLAGVAIPELRPFAKAPPALRLKMGKSAKRKQLETLKREFLAQHGDGRSEEARAQARAMLETLQRKLDDDALREDGMSPPSSLRVCLELVIHLAATQPPGFWFIDGACVDARRARLTPGMKAQSYVGHSRRVKSVTVVEVPCQSRDHNESGSVEPDTTKLLFTFAADKYVREHSPRSFMVAGS